MGKHDKKIVAADVCPKCSGSLDTGWECVECGFDAMPIATTPANPEEQVM